MSSYYVPAWDDETPAIGLVDPDEVERMIALAEEESK